MNREEAKKRVKELVEKYTRKEESGEINRYTEQETKKDFIEPLFEAVGWNVRDSSEVTAEESISKKRVDYGFRINNIPKFFLEAKSLREDLSNPEFVKQAVNYAWHKGCTWAVLTNFKEIYVFNSEVKSLNPLQIMLFSMNCHEFSDKFNQLILLSKESFEQGAIDKEAEKWGKKLRKVSVDKQLLADFTIFRESLSKNVMKLNQSRNLTESDLDESVQRILDRLIFIRNCEDRELEPKILISNFREWESRGRGQLIKNLRKVFEEFDQKYNSKLFQEHLCDTLEIDNEILSEIISGLYHTKDMAVSYDFSAIEADVLGNIYEQYLGHILKKTEKRAKLTESHAHRKEQGIYYTPTYIVDYIVRNTLGEMLKDKDRDAQKIRVLDPACGSGSFLIRAFDVFKEHHQQKADAYTQVNYDEILRNNIFGVDLDKQAVEIAQLNLLLKIAEKGHKLPLLEQNIKCGNSLIDDESVAGDKAFRWEKEFSEIMKDGGFDVVVGNPPYGADLKEHDMVFLSKKLKTSTIKNYDTYVFFIENSIKLLKEGGLFGFIVPDTFLRKSDMLPLREVILNNFKVRSIVEAGAVFGEAKVTENIIFIFEKCSKKENREKSILIHRTLDKERSMEDRLNLISKNEWDSEGQISQKSWTESPEMRLGKFNDPKLLKIVSKIEKGEAIGNIEDIEISRGSEGGKNLITNKPLNSSHKPIVIPEDIDKYSFKFNNRFFPIRDPNSFKYQKEKIVIIRIRNTKLKDRIIAAYDSSGTYTLKTLQILNLKEGSPHSLEYILGILNSKLMNFYCHHFLSDDINKRYIEGLRLILSPKKEDKNKLIGLADKMLSLNKRLNELGDKKTDERAKIEEEIKKTDAEIDELVYKIYGITEEEKKVVEGSLS